MSQSIVVLAGLTHALVALSICTFLMHITFASGSRAGICEFKRPDALSVAMDIIVTGLLSATHVARWKCELTESFQAILI